MLGLVAAVREPQPVVVGVADDMVFEAIAQLSERNVGQKDPCAMAAQAAGLALRTMTGTE